MLIRCRLVTVSDGAETAVGNICTTSTRSQDKRHKQTFSTQQAILRTSYALRSEPLDHKRHEGILVTPYIELLINTWLTFVVFSASKECKNAGSDKEQAICHSAKQEPVHGSNEAASRAVTECWAGVANIVTPSPASPYNTEMMWTGG